MSRIAFPFTFQGGVLHVEITPSYASSYELHDGAPLPIEHWGAPLLLTPEDRAAAAIPPAAAVAPFRQPAGRAPRRCRPSPRPAANGR